MKKYMILARESFTDRDGTPVWFDTKKEMNEWFENSKTWFVELRKYKVKEID